MAKRKRLENPGSSEPIIELELFVSGATPKSMRAIEALTEICKSNLKNTYRLKVVDIYREPALAKKNDVFAVPALILHGPHGRRVFIGDFTDPGPVLKSFGVKK